MKKILAPVKNFIAANQTKILATTTIVSTTFLAVEFLALANHDAFLKQHDLFDEFYNPAE